MSSGGPRPDERLLKVLVFEDNTEYPELMVDRWAKAGIQVVGVATTVPQMRELVTTTEFDVAVLDLKVRGVPGLPGLQIARWLLAHRAEAGVLVYTNVDNEDCVAQLLRTAPVDRLDGARPGRGYLIKDSTPVRDLPGTIRRIHAGAQLIDERLATELTRQAAELPPPDLTDKEKAVLRLLGEGLTNIGIAAELHIEPSTVTEHLSSIFDKLRIHSDEPTGKRLTNKRLTAALFAARHPDLIRPASEPMLDW
jgi:DNA-binding NarL/FixJ family response regulator